MSVVLIESCGETEWFSCAIYINHSQIFRLQVFFEILQILSSIKGFEIKNRSSFSPRTTFDVKRSQLVLISEIFTLFIPTLVRSAWKSFNLPKNPFYGEKIICVATEVEIINNCRLFLCSNVGSLCCSCHLIDNSTDIK